MYYLVLLLCTESREKKMNRKWIGAVIVFIIALLLYLVLINNLIPSEVIEPVVLKILQI